MKTQNILRYRLRSLLFLLCIFMLSGCLSPIALNRAVVVYDEAMTSAMSEQLLINIARASPSTSSFHQSFKYRSHLRF